MAPLTYLSSGWLRTRHSLNNNHKDLYGQDSARDDSPEVQRVLPARHSHPCRIGKVLMARRHDLHDSRPD